MKWLPMVCEMRWSDKNNQKKNEKCIKNKKKRKNNLKSNEF